MRVWWPGSTAKTSGASQYEYQTPGEWSDSGGVRVCVGDQSKSSVHDTRGGGYNAGRSAGAAISALAGVPPWRAGGQRGSVG